MRFHLTSKTHPYIALLTDIAVTVLIWVILLNFGDDNILFFSIVLLLNLWVLCSGMIIDWYVDRKKNG